MLLFNEEDVCFVSSGQCFSNQSNFALSFPLQEAFGKVWRQSSSSELRTEWECYCHLVGGARDAAKNPTVQELPGGLVVRMLGFHCCSLGSVP